jgi:tyrosyl-tRNA synthetase
LAKDDPLANLPTFALPRAEAAGLDLASLFVRAGLAASKGEARRLIRQGGAYADEKAIDPSEENALTASQAWFESGQATLRAGKKRYKIVRLT